MNNPNKYWDPTGYAVTDWDKANLTQVQRNAIQAATDDWEKAKKLGDKVGMAKANAAANAIRTQGGYSGGSNGNTITIINNDTTVNTRTYSNTGTTNSLTTASGTKVTITNTGTIVTMNVAAGATTTVNNRGSITTVNNRGTTTINNITISNAAKTSYIGTVNNFGTINNIDNSGRISSIVNNNTGSIDTINNKNTGSISTINNMGSIAAINNYGNIVGIRNRGSFGTFYHNSTFNRPQVAVSFEQSQIVDGDAIINGVSISNTQIINDRAFGNAGSVTSAFASEAYYIFDSKGNQAGYSFVIGGTTFRVDTRSVSNGSLATATAYNGNRSVGSM